MPSKTYVTCLLIIGILLLTHTLAVPISAAFAPSGNPNPVSNSTAPSLASSSSTEDAFHTCYLSCWEIHYVEPAGGLSCIKTCKERDETSPAGTPLIPRAVPSSAPPAAAAAATPSGSPPSNTTTPNPSPSDINKALVECYHSCHGRTDDQDRFELLNCIYTCKQRQNASPVEPALLPSPPSESESKSESQPPRDGPTSPQQKKKKRTADTDATARAIANLAESDVDVDVD